MKRIALVGNPNSGKTTLFNSLTGSTAHVGNWPGVTVDKKEGTYKKGKEEVSIIDLPGIYSLSPYTPEEVISRNYIIDEKPDCVINIIDTTNLERNLYLTTQLMEMDVPIVLALNMMDILEKQGDYVDTSGLEKELGIPVIKISALKENNLKKLIDKAIEESDKDKEGKSVLFSSPISHLIKDLTISFHSIGVANPLFHACKLAELDELEVKNHPNLVELVEHFREENVDDKFKGDYEALIADARYKYIVEHYSPFLIRSKEDNEELTKSEKIDRLLTHRIWGIPIFVGILFLIFHLVFSANFLFLGGLIQDDCFSFINDESIFAGFKGLFYTTEGINSPGVILQNLMIGVTELLSNLLSQGLTSMNAPSWMVGLMSDGILGGVFAVLTFLPQILLLFLLFSILEDSGYMARVAFILDRLFRKFGLSGRSFLPMIMGFGCSVPAMINTRTIADEKERVATIRVIPFFSCGAKLPILTAISGAIASMLTNSVYIDLITLGMYLLGMSVAVITVLIMRITTMRGKSSPFIMELPTYRKPQLKSTILLVWDKGKHFVHKAFTIILASTIVIWFISHFTFNWQYLDDVNLNNSILASLGQLVQPLFIPLGFGLPNLGWVFVVAIISGLIAKENTIGTLETLIASLSALSSTSIALFVTDNGFTIPMLLSFVAFNMLTIPCFAAVATAKGELNRKQFYFTLIFWLITSYIVSSMIYTIGSYVWTLPIWLVIILLFVITLYLYNKRMIKKENRRILK